MALTLAELRARKHKSLPTHVQRLTLDQDLLADIQRLETERSDLIVEAQRHKPDPDEEQDGPPRKMAERALPPRVDEIKAELTDLYDRLRKSEGELLLRGVSGAEWQQWKDDHPPREDNVTDEQVAYGICNATDLLNDLGRYVVSWEGEDLAPDDWSGWFAAQVAPGDLRDLVNAVVLMHERSGVRAPKSLNGSSATQDGAND